MQQVDDNKYIKWEEQEAVWGNLSEIHRPDSNLGWRKRQACQPLDHWPTRDEQVN